MTTPPPSRTAEATAGARQRSRSRARPGAVPQAKNWGRLAGAAAVEVTHEAEPSPTDAIDARLAELTPGVASAPVLSRESVEMHRTDEVAGVGRRDEGSDDSNLRIAWRAEISAEARAALAATLIRLGAARSPRIAEILAAEERHSDQ